MPKTRTKRSVKKADRRSRAIMLAIVVIECRERRGIRVNAKITAQGAE